jgi:hypothetical protein
MLLNLCIKGIDCASVSPPSGIGDLGPYLLSRLGPLVVLLPNWLSIKMKNNNTTLSDQFKNPIVKW